MKTLDPLDNPSAIWTCELLSPCTAPPSAGLLLTRLVLELLKSYRTRWSMPTHITHTGLDYFVILHHLSAQYGKSSRSKTDRIFNVCYVQQTHFLGFGEAQFAIQCVAWQRLTLALLVQILGLFGLRCLILDRFACPWPR